MLKLNCDFSLLYNMYTDTASVYKNERFIGEALKDVCMTLGIDEKEVLITTKLGLSQAATHIQPRIGCIAA